ncbi:MAG: kynureninase [Halieaceae bacterium]|jgi:kynureninase|nr:kynureninase [Halieaceae bacterium]
MDQSRVAALDNLDPLRDFRQRFVLPADKVYLDGNSLGALAHEVEAATGRVLREQWGDDLIASWNSHGWIDLPLQVGEKIAPLLGAAPGQVICADSLSVNLFKVLAAALQLRPGRHRIVSAADNFPTDLYLVQGLSALLGTGACELVQVPEEAVAEALDQHTAVLLLSHVNFRSGRLLPMTELTAAARDVGAMSVWDLAHSAGVMPLALDAEGVDFAVGCGYKFLNGGPGAPGFLYAARRHHGGLSQPLTGWMGHRAPFDFSPDYAPAAGVLQFLCGTPPVLSMAALDAALEMFKGLDLAVVRAKSISLATLFLELLHQRGLSDLFTLASPAQAALRGSHLALRHPLAYGVVQAWIARGVVADFREPDILRVGFAPLYNSHADVLTAVDALQAVLRAEEHRDPRWQQRQRVT